VQDGTADGDENDDEGDDDEGYQDGGLLPENRFGALRNPPPRPRPQPQQPPAAGAGAGAGAPPGELATALRDIGGQAAAALRLRGDELIGELLRIETLYSEIEARGRADPDAEAVALVIALAERGHTRMRLAEAHCRKEEFEDVVARRFYTNALTDVVEATQIVELRALGVELSEPVQVLLAHEARTRHLIQSASERYGRKVAQMEADRDRVRQSMGTRWATAGNPNSDRAQQRRRMLAKVEALRVLEEQIEAHSDLVHQLHAWTLAHE
jgi:hypothetical protein